MAKTLGQLDNSTGITALANALQNENQGIRLAAAEALGHINDTRSLSVLMDAPKDSHKSEALVSGAQAIKSAGDAAEIGPLTSLLQNIDVEKRDAAAYALGVIEDSRAVEDLVVALQDENASIRFRVATALGAIGNSRAVTALTAGLGDQDAMVACEAAWALGEIKDIRAVEPLIEALRGKRRRGDDSSVEFAVMVAAFAGIISPAPKLDLALYRTARQSLQATAATALGEIGDKRAVGALVEALANEEWCIRDAAAQSLKKLGWQPTDDIQRSLQIVALRDWAQAIRLGPVAIEPLVRAYRDSSPFFSDIKVEVKFKSGMGDTTDNSNASISVERIDGKCREEAAAALRKLGWRDPESKTAAG
ncbi:MAG: HEAT repeat domain-containing protein [Acidobacteria bacterium]|nr:HEAT repeat domain-containing protein [Acidobacteriota bacterium]